MTNIKIIKDKMLGCLYGHVIGDALGLGTEFIGKVDYCEKYLEGFE